MKKKIFALLSALMMTVCVLAGCSNSVYKHYSDETYDKQFAEPQKGDTMARFVTNMGDIVIKLFPKEAPKAVENFTTHAQEGYYDGVIFHRVIEDFMIQGGDPTGTGTGGESIWGSFFEDETCEYLAPYRGALCMANRGYNTNGSQFFIVTSTENDVFDYKRWNMDIDPKYQFDEAKLDKFKEVGGAIHLDFQVSNLRAVMYPETYSQYIHTVFGHVMEGMDIVDAISHVDTYGEMDVTEAKILHGVDQTDVLLDKPREDVIIETIEIYTYGK
ncbi:MAG: peptidylprolyl isomerase [Firmicutes bacterium]|nr:peptidylprolyl isomerase [Bacillota bacterium]